MPFEMGPAGWFLWPYLARWWYPYYWMLPYWFPFPPLTREEETTMLEEQAKIIEAELTRVKNRLAELQKTK